MCWIKHWQFQVWLVIVASAFKTFKKAVASTSVGHFSLSLVHS